MYRVSIIIRSNGKKKDEACQIFELDGIDSELYHDQMNEIADYLYELDIPFDVDEGGDMLIDDILMTISDEEAFEQVIQEKKKTYIIKGEQV